MHAEAVDHLVIGGGPAGSMMALQLAEAGRQVTLLEKERAAHHKVCGEFLSHEAVEYLRQAGVSARDLGAASIRNVRLAAGHKAAEVQLPFQALSLSRCALDEALLQRAADKGCEVMRGASVVRLSACDGVWTVSLDDGRSLRAHSVFLATGKHDLHGWNRGRGEQSDLIGFKLHWRLAPAQTEELREWMDLFLFTGGYGGLSLVETEIANLCLVVRRCELRRIGSWQNLLAAAMRENRRLRHLLEGAEPLWARPLAISPIPYGYFAPSSCGLWRVGDQAAVVPSFTGDGMSIALHSAHLAAQMFLAGQSTEAYSRTLRAQLGGRINLATWISRAIVTDAGRSSAILAASLFPGAMRWIAASTRVPAAALLFNPAR
ncbi:MAG TPA: FAD-dependent oxidoreductase [Terracidiphilus sp.]|nr:FAD-dependent oxidoreductase [Terracidiphilus sp.]